ncbi:MAG: hypothetical protein JSW28_07935 [Thermoplasmata archaeon]|nr:MAG: hypothetical protein JSW28_07935 [Thermoplasmata archaeon]
MAAMSFREKRRQAKYEKKMAKARKELSLHLFSVAAAEQNAPTHWKIDADANREEKERYLEHRMRLRRKWIDKFFEFHPDIDPKIRSELRKEAYEDAEIVRRNMRAKRDLNP